MKLKSETKQVIEFLKHRFDCVVIDATLLDATKQLNLNYDMVQRALILLHKKNVIGRDSRGPRSQYEYPTRIGLGDIVEAVEGIEEPVLYGMRDALNKVQI